MTSVSTNISEEIFVSPHTFEVFQKVFFRIGKGFRLFINFQVFVATRKILSSPAVLSVKNQLRRTLMVKYHVS